MKESRLLKIEKDVAHLKKELIIKEPEHFSIRDIISAFFGALVIGLTFMFKGLLIQQSITLSFFNVGIIVLTTLALMALEIYFIGYTRVQYKHKRKPGQFILKRLTAIYLISFTVSLYLVNIFGISKLAGNIENIMKIVLVLTLPCGIGATLSDLLKSY
ncbi:DUF2391 family protein [Candidatus Woesearchaeota archaeon]|nr:DUF2391 family protein [Candidatus Woesearchaeota archaeon]